MILGLIVTLILGLTLGFMRIITLFIVGAGSGSGAGAGTGSGSGAGSGSGSGAICSNILHGITSLALIEYLSYVSEVATE